MTGKDDKKIIFRRMKILIFSLTVTIFLFSCSLDYDTSVKEELSDTIPSSILYDVSRVQVKNGVPRASFSAEEAKIWEEREDTELFDVKFLEYDSSRGILTEGTADYLLINKNNDATIQGNISGYSSQNEASMTAESLQWEDETRILKSTDEKRVEISMDDGSVLKGRGFNADFYSNTIGFSSDVNGSIETSPGDADE